MSRTDDQFLDDYWFLLKKYMEDNNIEADISLMMSGEDQKRKKPRILGWPEGIREPTVGDLRSLNIVSFKSRHLERNQAPVLVPVYQSLDNARPIEGSLVFNKTNSTLNIYVDGNWVAL